MNNLNIDSRIVALKRSKIHVSLRNQEYIRRNKEEQV